MRSFDNKYYAKAAVVEAPSVPGWTGRGGVEFVRAHTDRVRKGRLTGAYTMEDGSYDEHYGHERWPRRLGRAPLRRTPPAWSTTWP